MDSEDNSSQGLRVPTQKSYSSSETLKAFDQHQDQTRLVGLGRDGKREREGTGRAKTNLTGKYLTA